MLYLYLETTKTLEKESSNAGAIAGGVIGACVVLFVIAGILSLRYHADVILHFLTNAVYSNHIYWQNGYCNKNKIINLMKKVMLFKFLFHISFHIIIIF